MNILKSYATIYDKIILLDNFNPDGQFSYVSGVRISVEQHRDKKPLERYDKDSECVHSWLPIEFITEK